MSAVSDFIGLIDARVERERNGVSVAEEAVELQGSLRKFLRAAWPYASIGHRLVDTWHLDAIADHVQAAYEREIPRLVVTIQPGAMKSSIVSVLAPAWRWAGAPDEQIVSASHGDSLATRDTRRSRSVIATPWYFDRWPHVKLLHDENLKTRYTNTRGGWRIATHVGGGTGERGSCLILDDPHNAQDALSTTQTRLQNARDWMGNTWASRLNVVGDDPGVKMVIGQRVHENDVIGMLLDGDPTGDRWTHLCLPTEWHRKHPFVYPSTVKLPSGRKLKGDPRRKEGELLSPAVVSAKALAEIQSDMSERTKQAQYQQLPTPREGAILKRSDWRYFPREWLNGDPDAATWQHRFPVPFRMIVCSWDTSFKAKVTSDKVAGGAWGVSLRWTTNEAGQPVMAGSDHYLLATRNERLSLQQTKDAMKEMRAWCLRRWPGVPIYVVIEKSANGVEIIEQLEREIDGTLPVVASVDKKLRAEAASPALESHNVYLPGQAKPDGTGPDEARTDANIMAAVEQAARFTGQGNEEDDWVDQFTQAINWTRTKDLRPVTVEAPPASARIRIGGVGEGRSTGIRIGG